MTLSPKTKILLLRFARVFVFSAIGSMASLSPIIVNDWQDLGTWISMLILSGITGGISGILAAYDKSGRIIPEELM
jgi:hypothetical protein